MRQRTDRSRPQARKRFGQHFLEPAWARKVVDAIGAEDDDVFVEIGPGPGAITRLLAARVHALAACEIDRDLAALLREEAIPGVQVLEGDFLDLGVDRLRTALAEAAPGAASFRVAGNLPYNVAAPIMFRLVELTRLALPLVDATLMLQREVAERLLASPGTGEFGILTVLIGHRATVTRLLNLPPGAFRPAPKVRSTVVRLRFHGPQPPVTDERVMAAVTHAVFTRRRKTLANALLAYGGLPPGSAMQVLAEAGIDAQRRPETLSIAEFGHLADAVVHFTREIVHPSNRPIPNR